jgi:hypothetical protein
MDLAEMRAKIRHFGEPNDAERACELLRVVGEAHLSARGPRGIRKPPFGREERLRAPGVHERVDAARFEELDPAPIGTPPLVALGLGSETRVNTDERQARDALGVTHGDAERKASPERIAGEMRGRRTHRFGESIHLVVERSNAVGSCSVS